MNSDTESCDIPDMIPPLFAAFPIVVEFILQSEIGEIPLNSFGNGTFCTFAKKDKDNDNDNDTNTDTYIVLEEQIDESYLTMSLIDFNSYVKILGLSDKEKAIYIHKRRQLKNRGYSKVARLKRKHNTIHNSPLALVK